MPPKRRRRFQGLYYHSSPPKVLSMSGGVSNQNLRKRRDADDFSVKLSTIRIWMHEKDIGKLTRILWAGQGNRLRQQASTNAKVKRFLAAVPYVMNSIKDVHQAVIDNNLETLQASLEPPVPPALITCKDANGLNVIHKAAGLGHAMILEFLIGVWSDGSHETDITGKTPLHWAASCKNNMRCYTLLTQAGCDEEAQDYKMKTPSYYRHKPHEIERAFLVFVPEAPRVSPDIATDWEALSEDTGDGKKLDIKIPDVLTNGLHDRSNDNISEADVIEGEIEMHEDEKPDEDETDVAEAAASAAETAEEAELEEPEESHEENDVDPSIEPKAEDDNEKNATDENISNDMNDKPTTPTTTNMEEAEEHQGDDDDDDDGDDDGDDGDGNDNEEAHSETAVENNDDKEEKALDTNADTKTDEEEVKNNELTETTEDTAEETKENFDKNEATSETEETHVEDKSAEEELESETVNLLQKTDEEKLDETVRIAEVENTEQDGDTTVDNEENEKENENEEQANEHENDSEEGTKNLQKPIKYEDFDIDKANDTLNAENEEDATEDKKNTEDVTTNDIDETENGGAENLTELGKETEEHTNENDTENGDEEMSTNENQSNEEDSASQTAKIDNEINNNEAAELEEVPIENDSTHEDHEEVMKTNEPPNKTNGVEEKNNNEIVVQKNAENEKRMHSATSAKSLGKLSLENGKITTQNKAMIGNGRNDSASSKVSNKHVDNADDDDDDDEENDNIADDDDDDQDKVDKAAESEAVPTEEHANKTSDENHNEEHYEVDSPTSSLAIEGYIQGESEDNTVQSQSAANVDEESRIQDIIASGDMEQLAQIVLNGDGNKLLNMQAPEPEIQAFLNNVPNYMNKIRRVHEAARDGNIMALQQALDRRKFAIAKDEISPNGTSPLHVAVLFGHADIVRYLAARFPETTTMTDDDGRTALHYAATIKDNGHFYNVLTQLGANPLAVDKLGHTPKFFLESEEAKDVLTYRQLLETFGAAELEKELLNDQGQVEGNCLETNPIFKTEQGKYLASTLAEPLTKALTEIANIRPEDPVAFLASFLKKYVRNAESNSNLNRIRTNSTAVIESTATTENPAAPNTMGTGSGKIGHAQQNGNIQNGNADEIEEEQSASPDDSSQPKLEDRDEHGQSMLHFSSARSHRRGGLLHMIEESKIDITYRDELYRTARDVSLQANQPANAKEIDHYVLSLAVVGDLAPFEHFALSGYDHIIDVVNDEGEGIIDVALAKGHDELADFLKNIRSLEEQREELHESIRENNIARVHELTAGPYGKWLISAKNYYGRTAMHIAVLKESEEIVQHFVGICPEALKIGDNLERNSLHYAMGTNAVETISRILIQKGAKRTNKDLKGRQPTYYFMNKADILRLQEEEDENR